jgi:putative sterol carrier protein
LTVTGSGATRQPSAPDAFFGELTSRGREPLLKSASGALRFDLLDGERIEHWYVTMHEGDVTVSRKKGRADAVLRLERSTFDGLVSGRINAMAATLRGDLVPEGDLGLVLLFQRLFPGPPSDVPATSSTASEGT